MCQATIESRHGDDPELGLRAQAPLFAIVNNAGVMEGSLEDILRVRAAAACCAAHCVAQVNLHGPALVSKHFLPLLQPGGRVVMVHLTLRILQCTLCFCLIQRILKCMPHTVGLSDCSLSATSCSVAAALFVAGCLLVGLGLFSCRAFVCIQML